MNNLVFDDRAIVIISLIFWLTPIALAIHLARIRDRSLSVKVKLASIYGGLWIIAFGVYSILFATFN